VIQVVAGTTAWPGFLDGWHEFFLMTGTAAVTLAGLLFVAISMHLETLIHDSRAHLLALARAILLSFVMVLTFSLMMLVPAQGMRPVATQMVLMGAVSLIITLRLMRTPSGVHHPEFPHALFIRRLAPTLIGYAMISLAGLLILKSRTPDFFFIAIAAFCMLLGNAAGASWDLMVRTARIRRREASEGATKKAGVG
jgi:predicted neutral ceramidase superfamily lipid hydrolase